MKRRVAAGAGTGPWSSGLSRRLVRGGPSMVRSLREAPKASSTRGSSAVNAGAVHPVIARKLPARWVTSSELGIDTADTRSLVVRHDTL
jgi:hypothetical protein